MIDLILDKRFVIEEPEGPACAEVATALREAIPKEPGGKDRVDLEKNGEIDDRYVDEEGDDHRPEKHLV